MMKYIKVNEKSEVVRVGTIDDALFSQMQDIEGGGLIPVPLHMNIEVGHIYDAATQKGRPKNAGEEKAVWDAVNERLKKEREDAEAKIIAGMNVDERRRRAYPPLTDLADALYHKEQGNPKPFQDWLVAVKAVKDRFSK